MRLNPAQRQATEQRIHQVMGQLLDGDIPPGGRCDIATLARESGVDRTAFYGTKPYAPLREQFEQRLAARRHDGDDPDPRDAQITRLKTDVTALRNRLTASDQQAAVDLAFKNTALSRLAAQHQEITRLRRELERATGVRRLPTP